MGSRSVLAGVRDAALRRVGPLVASTVDELGARALWYRSAACFCMHLSTTAWKNSGMLGSISFGARGVWGMC